MMEPLPSTHVLDGDSERRALAGTRQLVLNPSIATAMKIGM